MTPAEASNIVIGPILDMLKGAGSLTSDMSGHGSSLLAVLTGVVLSWNGIKIAMEMSSINETIGKFVNLILIVSITFLLFDNYDEYFSPDGILISGFDVLASTFGMGSFEYTIKNVVGNFFTMAGKIVGITDTVASTDGGIPASTPENGGFWDSMTNIGPIIGGLVDFLPAIILRAGAAIVTILAGAIFAIQMLMSQIAIVIGAIIGPIMIPWMLIPATSFLFDGWLKFMITAGMWKVVGAIIISIVTPALNSTAEKIANMDIGKTAFGEQTLLAMGCLILAIVFAVMMSKIQELASALVSGGTIGGISQRWAMSTISTGARAPGKGFYSGSKGTGAAVQGYKAHKAAGASGGKAAMQGISHGARTAAYTYQNTGKAEKPGKLPSPPKPPGGGGG